METENQISIGMSYTSQVRWAALPLPQLPLATSICSRRSQVDKEAAVIRAKADKEAKIIVGNAEAEAIKILSEAHSRNPEFYNFLRQLETYEKSFSSGNSTIIIPENSNTHYDIKEF